MVILLQSEPKSLSLGDFTVPASVITNLSLSLSCLPRADEIEMIMTDLERANQVSCSYLQYKTPQLTQSVILGDALC